MTTCPTCGHTLSHDETTLGGFLRARREERGWSLRQVAKLTGDAISCPYLSQVEMGRIEDISARKLMALARVYNINPGSLMALAAGEAVNAPPEPVERRCFTFCGDACTCEARAVPLDAARRASERLNAFIGRALVSAAEDGSQTRSQSDGEGAWPSGQKPTEPSLGATHANQPLPKETEK